MRPSTLTGAERPARSHARTAAIAAMLLLAGAPLGAQSRYVQTNLVSDVPGLAATLDPQLVNPWGISFGATSPFWVSDAGAGVTTLYDGFGVKQALVVTIPGPGGAVPSVPTGQVFNNAGAAFALPVGGNATFLFASATGTISGWNGGSGTTAQTVVNGFANDASYTGLAIAGSGAGARLYAANFGTGKVDVFDNTFTPILPTAFTDPTLPAGYAPFNVQNVGGQIVVTYALVDPETGEEMVGAGNGFVDVFDADGVLVRRLVSDGVLNAPWGVALAPAGFGSFGGSLLVGSFGDGTIHAFDPLTGALVGQLLDPTGAPIENEGLWGIAFGNGGTGFDPNALYFTAGIDDETHGLFGKLSVNVVPEPGTLALMATGLGLVMGATWRRRRSGVSRR